AVVVDVPASDAHRAKIAGALNQGVFSEMTIALVVEEDAVAELIDDIEVGPSIVVGVEPDRREARAAIPAGAAGGRHVLESPVAEVAHQIVAFRAANATLDPGIRLFRRAAASHIKIDAAIAIEIGQGNAGGVGRQSQVRLPRYVRESL